MICCCIPRGEAVERWLFIVTACCQVVSVGYLCFLPLAASRGHHLIEAPHWHRAINLEYILRLYRSIRVNQSGIASTALLGIWLRLWLCTKFNWQSAISLAFSSPRIRVTLDSSQWQSAVIHTLILKSGRKSNSSLPNGHWEYELRKGWFYRCSVFSLLEPSKRGKMPFEQEPHEGIYVLDRESKAFPWFFTLWKCISTWNY